MPTKKIRPIHQSGQRPLWPWLGIAAIVVLLDQLSKITITKLLAQTGSIALTSFFNLVLAYNKGAAFSFLAGASGWQRYFFSATALAAIGLILFFLKRHAGQKLFCWSLALILGGALGNLIDRLLYGHVIDFLDVYYRGWHWPAFNLADSAICLGAGLFVLDELRRVNR